MVKEHSRDTGTDLEATMGRAEIGRIVGGRLRDLREKRRLSVVQLAEAVGVHRQTVYSWEAGDSWPGLDDWLKISSALDLHVSTLFRRLFARV